jgi:PAS domain S-box-containing protein
MPAKNLETLKNLIHQVLQDPKSIKEELSSASIEHLMETISVYQEELEYQNEELRRTQELLSLSERRYASLFYGSPMGLLLMDKEGKIKDVNQAFLMLIEQENAVVKDKPLRQFIHENAQDAFYLFWRTVGEQKELNPVELALAKPNNEAIDVIVKVKQWEWHYANEDYVMLSFSNITELKKRKLEVEHQHYLLQQAQEIANLGFCKLNPENNQIECSEMTRTIFEIPEKHSTDYHFFLSFLTNDAQAQWRRLMQKSMQDFSKFDFIAEIQTYTKTQKWIRIVGKAVMQNGHILVFSTVQDISSTKTTLDRLRILDKAIIQSPVSIVITDVAGNIQFVNPKFSQITGYSFEEALGKNPRILKSGMLKPDDYKSLWHAISNGETWRGTFLNISKTGREFWEKATLSPIRNEEGVITNYLGIKEDITEQLKSENLLKESQRRYRVVADNTLNWEFWQAPDGSFIYHSPSCEKISGLKPEVFIQSPDAYFHLIHPDDLEDYKAHHDCRGERLEEEVVEFRITTPQGIEKVIEHTCKPIFDEDGIYLGIRGTNVDVSERSIYVRRIEKQNNVLKEIAWTQSHELRGPLTRALSLIPFLKERDFSIFDYPELVAAIDQTLNELDALVLKISEKTHLTKE